jgi:hypothetical protein
VGSLINQEKEIKARVTGQQRMFDQGKEIKHVWYIKRGHLLLKYIYHCTTKAV